MSKLSEEAEGWLSFLGDFELSDSGDKIEGYMPDGNGQGCYSVSLDSKKLRSLSKAMLEIADILDNSNKLEEVD